MTGKRLTVVIPTHNRKKLLLELLSSLSRQTVEPDDFEVIVVVDGHPDNTVEEVGKQSFPFALQVFEQPQSGPATARNRGASQAKGEVVLFLDDDILPQPDLLTEHLRLHDGISPTVVIGRLLPSTSKEKKGWHIWEERVLKNHFAAMKSGKRPAAGRRLYSGNFSVTRSAFEAVGGFDTTYQRGEDIELGFRLEKYGAKFHFNHDAAAVHRGFRTFESWRSSAHQYGVTDVLLSERQGHATALPEIFRWYHRQPSLMRTTATFCIDRPTLRSGLISSLKFAGESFNKLHFGLASHYAYSGIYKLEFWQGVADQVGGKHDFLEKAALFAQGTPTPNTGS